MINIKNEEQIQGIRKSCKLLSQFFNQIEDKIEEGVTTRDLNSWAETFIRDHGGIPSFKGYGGPPAFPTALCTSKNEVVIHGFPDDVPLKSGDIVSIDCGIKLDGFFSDRAMTYAIGEVSQKVKKLLRITKESLEKGISKVKAGNRIRDISRAVFDHTNGNGFGVIRDYCGHGVGLEVHEEPQIPNYVGHGPNPRLKEGMVLAIEPMITLGTHEVTVLEDDWTVVTQDASWAAHFEHTVLVTKDGYEILTL